MAAGDSGGLIAGRHRHSAPVLDRSSGSIFRPLTIGHPYRSAVAHSNVLAAIDMDLGSVHV